MEIDWFASKMGLLIFVLAAMGILITFLFVELDIYAGAQKANAASDIARLIETAEDGMEIIYPVKISSSYSLKISSDHLNLDGFVRYFIVKAETQDGNPIADAKKIMISKKAGEPVKISKLS